MYYVFTYTVMCHSASLGDPLLLMCALLSMMYDLICYLKQPSNVEPRVPFSLWMENAEEYFVYHFVIGIPLSQIRVSHLSDNARVRIQSEPRGL